MRRALALLAVAPFLPLACGSFGTSAVIAPTDGGEASAPVDDAAGDEGPAALFDGPTPSVGDARVPPECPLRECVDSVPGEDCKDDDCDESEFTITGGAERDNGSCKLASKTTGYFESDRPRGSTSSRFVELAFDLISVDVGASAVMAQLFVAGSMTPRVELLAAEGALSLCVVTGSIISCAPGNVGLPKERVRLHLYGVIDGTAGARQTFGLRIDCNDVLQVEMGAPFGAGTTIVGRVGCIDAPCAIAADDLVFLTRP